MTKQSLDEFRIMINRAVDREELETIRLMLLEAPDLALMEKTELSAYVDRRYNQLPELRVCQIR